MSYQNRQRVLAALTDRRGNPKPWYTAEEIGYSPSCEGMSTRQISAALSWFAQRGLVEHVGREWKIASLGIAALLDDRQRWWRDYAAPHPDDLPVRERSNYLTSYAGWLLENGENAAVVRDRLVVEADRLGFDPREGEVSRIVRSVRAKAREASA